MNRQIVFAIMLTIGAIVLPKPRLIFGQQSSDAAAAQKDEQKGEQPAGTITGRVVNESGQPMPNAMVYVMAAGRRESIRPVTTDQEGKFQVDNLRRGIYSVSVQARGYVSTVDPRRPTYYRPGESVNVVVKKGGVITGTVTNSAGEPVIGVPVAAVFLRDPDGRPTQGLGPGVAKYTDDRGVYRLFSLPPGTYLVVASSKSFGRSNTTAFDEDIPTYYPSSTRDTASEVEVRAGSEATGIDIRHRGEHGYAISGSITGGSVAGQTPVGMNVTLLRAVDGAIESQVYAQPRGNDSPFGFYGIGEGEYLLVAQRYTSPDDDGARSRPVRVKVKGQDITGVELSLVSLSSIAGRVVLEGNPGGNTVRCDKKRAASIDESLFSVRRVQKDDPKEPPIPPYEVNISTAPGEKGEFLHHGVDAGQYQVEARMLDETLYVRAISMPRTGRVATPIDVGRGGFAVKSGERATGLTISVAEGAASLSGKVVVETKGGSLPERLRVHLVPAEQEAADDLLRFAESVVRGDGTFTLNNVPPGRYRVVARQASEEEARERFPRPIAWNMNARRSLIRDAEALNLVIDLKPCQRVSDYALRYTPTKEAPKPQRR